MIELKREHSKESYSQLESYSQSRTHRVVLSPGSPIGDFDSVDLVIKDKISSLQLMGDWLHHHDAILFLRHSFSIPRLMNLFCTAPAFLALFLSEYTTLCCVVS